MKMVCLLVAAVIGCGAASARAATAAAPAASAPAAQVDPGLEKQAKAVVDALQLQDAAKAQKVHDLTLAFVGSVRDFHNAQLAAFAAAHPGEKESVQQMTEADLKLPREVHQKFVNGLEAVLTPGQVEAVKDKLTEGKVDFTMRGYKAIVPDLKPAEEAVILANLKQAREEAMDVKGSKEMSAVFKTYKTKNEAYLDSQGRNWKQLYKAYVDGQKAKKAAATQPAE